MNILLPEICRYPNAEDLLFYMLLPVIRWRGWKETSTKMAIVCLSNIYLILTSKRPVQFSWSSLHCLHSKWIILTPETGPLVNVANGIVMRTTTWVIFTADCSLKRTTSPWKAKFSNSKYTTTSSAWSTTVISTTNGWWVHRWRRRWSRIWGILALLYGIGRLHCNSTFTCHACC